MIKDNRDGKYKSWCEWILYTQEHPHKKVEKMTVKEFIQLQQHVDKCRQCLVIVDEVIEKNPTKLYPKHLEN